MRQLIRIAVLGFVVAALAAPPAARAEPLKIRIGWSTMPGHMIPVLFQNPNILRHLGNSYVVEPILFRGSSPQLTALAAGEIDVMTSSSGTLALAVTNANLDVKVIADCFQEGVPGYHSETFVTRADSGITKVEDLRGKRIGSNAIGSASDSAMRARLDKASIKPRDFTTIQAAFPSMVALLDDKKVDLAPVLMPQLIGVEADPKYRVLFTAGDGLGHTDSVFLIGSADFIKAHRAGMQDFVEDYVRAMKWFKDPANKQAGSTIVAQYMKVPVSEVAYQFTNNDYYRDPNQRPDLPALQNTIDILNRIGLIPKTIKVVPDYADLTLLDEAVKRIAQSP